MTWVLWGRMSDGTPIRLQDGTLAAMRREYTYRKPLEARGGFTDLRIRSAGKPYDSCECATCRTEVVSGSS